MGIISAVRDYAEKKGFYKNTGDDYEEDDEYEEEEEEDEEERPYARKGTSVKPSGPKLLPPPRTTEYVYSDTKVIPIAEPSGFTDVEIFQPAAIEDSKRIIDSLLANKITFFSVDKLDAKDAQRVADFLSGAVYSIKGEMKEAGVKTFVAVPSGVTLTSRIIEDAKTGSGVFARFRSPFKL